MELSKVLYLKKLIFFNSI